MQFVNGQPNLEKILFAMEINNIYLVGPLSLFVSLNLRKEMLEIALHHMLLFKELCSLPPPPPIR